MIWAELQPLKHNTQPLKHNKSNRREFKHFSKISLGFEQTWKTMKRQWKKDNERSLNEQDCPQCKRKNIHDDQLFLQLTSLIHRLDIVWGPRHLVSYVLYCFVFYLVSFYCNEQILFLYWAADTGDGNFWTQLSHQSVGRYTFYINTQETRGQPHIYTHTFTHTRSHTHTFTKTNQSQAVSFHDLWKNCWQRRWTKSKKQKMKRQRKRWEVA